MHLRRRSLAPGLLRLAGAAFFIWWAWGWTQPLADMTPAESIDAARRLLVALTPLAAFEAIFLLGGWVLDRLHGLDDTSELHERLAAERAGQRRNCPACWASVVDDATSCPWCGHRFGASPSAG